MTKKIKFTAREKIVNMLHRNYTKVFTARGIAKAAKLNYNTVRRELGHLVTTLRVVIAHDRSKNGYKQYMAGLAQ